MSHLHKRSIVQKTVQVASSTMLSRIFGVIREVLQIRFLGVGLISDAFVTGLFIPSFLRKVFAEGALSAAFVPAFVKISREQTKEEANSIMSLAFIFFEGLVLLVCALIILFPGPIVLLSAPGFSAEQKLLAEHFVRYLITFIFFVSSNALLTAALQSVGHFFVPAIGQVIQNIVLIIGLMLCLIFKLSPTVYCIFFLIGGGVQLIMHLYMYFSLGFSFGRITKKAWYQVMGIMWTFLVCFISMSPGEISLQIDRMFASYLPEGSISLVYYANRFMGIPLGVFAAALSTILLPHFSRISIYAPKRLSFYLLESAKLIAWVTIPIMLLMSFLAPQIFRTISNKMTPEQIHTGAWLLIAFLLGLFFLSLNKIILNICYAFGESWKLITVTVLISVINICLNVIFLPFFGAPGLALATSIAAITQTVLLLNLLARHRIRVYFGAFLEFLGKFLLQLAAVSLFFFILYRAIEYLIAKLQQPLAAFFLVKIGFWFWAGPLCLLFFLVLWKVKQVYKLNLYFID